VKEKISEILAAGDLDSLMPIVYDELRGLAAAQLRRERPGHSLQPTALANEAYFKLVDTAKAGMAGRAHFFGVAARAMRRAARFCDGWIARAPGIDELAQTIPRMQAALEREGRSLAGFRVLAMCPDAIDESQLLRLADLGVDEIQLWPWNRYGVGLEDLPGKTEAVARFAEELILPIRSRLA